MTRRLLSRTGPDSIVTISDELRPKPVAVTAEAPCIWDRSRRPAAPAHQQAPYAGAPRRVRPGVRPTTSRRSPMTLTVTEAGLTLADPAVYADEARLHEALTLLRRK